MTLPARVQRSAPKGRDKPRLAPPVPARSDVAGFRQVASDVGIALMPWQLTAARYLEAQGRTQHLFREVAIIVARQNGKTTLLVPLIVKRLLEGRRIMHTAQNRDLPREVFGQVAEIMWSEHGDLFPDRNGRRTKPRYANGQEEIRLTNGGIYSIVAPTRSGARGPSRDLVIIDELREMDTWDFIAAAKPTLTASKDPQMVYLSNAGAENSLVLNAIRKRADSDPSLAYLEWSAAPERAANDRVGWAESNPAMGHEVDGMGSVMATLETSYQTAMLEGTIGIFETEHLCRWVISTRRRLVEEFAWIECAATELEPTARPALGIAMDPEGKRASAVLAWRQRDDTIALRLVAQTEGDPFSVDAFGDLVREAAKGCVGVVFDPLTDGALAKFVKKPKPEPVSGQKFSNASAQFANLVNAGLVRWKDADAVTDDLGWTARKDDDDTGSYQAVRADDDHPITASLAAIRAVWLASGPRLPRAKVM